LKLHRKCGRTLKARIRPLYLSLVVRDLTAFSLQLNRFFRTFGADKSRSLLLSIICRI
jgi:hypothetical protein